MLWITKCRDCCFCLLSIVSLIVYERCIVDALIDSIRSIQIAQPQRGIFVICNAFDTMMCNSILQHGEATERERYIRIKERGREAQNFEKKYKR